MRLESQRVLVIGAGIAGLAVARVLGGRAAQVEVVERGPAGAQDGFGIYLPGNASRAFDRLGLGEAVAGAAVHITHQRFLDHRGRLLGEVDVADAWRGVGPCRAMPRTALHRILLDGAAGVPIRWNVSAGAVTNTGDGVVVGFDDGTEQRYDLVVGADGVHSDVRGALFGVGERPVGQYAYRFLVPWPDAEPVWTVRLGRGTAMLTIPIDDGRVYCYCDGPLVAAPPPPRRLLDGYPDPVPQILDRLDASGTAPYAGPVVEVSLDTWWHGRVVLVGDAAHATSPNMAEGAAMAVEDALVLGECLDAASTLDEALPAFQTRRRPRTDWVRSQTHRRDRTRNLLPAVRNFVLRRRGQQIYRDNYRPLREEP